MANDFGAAFPVRCCFTLRFQKCLFSALRSGFFPPHRLHPQKRREQRAARSVRFNFPFTFISKEVACPGDVMVARRLHCGVSGLLADVKAKASQCHHWGVGGSTTFKCSIHPALRDRRGRIVNYSSSKHEAFFICVLFPFGAPKLSVIFCRRAMMSFMVCSFKKKKLIHRRVVVYMQHMLTFHLGR